MQTRELEQLLRTHGFTVLRSGSKHILWSKGDVRLPVSRGPTVVNARMVKCVRSFLRRLANGEPTGQPYRQEKRGDKPL